MTSDISANTLRHASRSPDDALPEPDHATARIAVAQRPENDKSVDFH